MERKLSWRVGAARFLGGNSMAMSEHSILVGKSYRTPEDEVREVNKIEDGEVTFRTVAAAHGPGMIARVAGRHLPLAQFAAEVESEVAG